MSLTMYEKGYEIGQPVRLFEFTYGTGSGDRYLYNSSDRDIEFDGDTYTAFPISMQELKRGIRPTSNPVEIRVPSNSPMSLLFDGTPPRRVILVRVFQGHLPNEGESDDLSTDERFSLLYSGNVIERQKKDETASLTCESFGLGLKRPGLTRFYSRECPFVLYGPRCQADKPSASFTATVSEVSGRQITVDDDNWHNGNDLANFIGGLVEWSGPQGTETRTIMGATATTIRVDSPVSGLSEDDPLTVVFGCARTMTACRDVHDNIVNFGGTPFVPRENPTNKNNHT